MPRRRARATSSTASAVDWCTKYTGACTDSAMARTSATEALSAVPAGVGHVPGVHHAGRGTALLVSSMMWLASQWITTMRRGRAVSHRAQDGVLVGHRLAAIGREHLDRDDAVGAQRGELVGGRAVPLDDAGVQRAVAQALLGLGSLLVGRVDGRLPGPGDRESRRSWWCRRRLRPWCIRDSRPGR